jgi:Glycosyl hydrolases related to GH101 family, GH129
MALEIANSQIKVTFEPKGGLINVRDLRTGRVFEQCAANAFATAEECHTESSGLAIRAQVAIRTIQPTLLDVRVALEPDRPEVVVEVAEVGQTTTTVRYPQPFLTDHESWLVLAMEEGMLFPAADPTSVPPKEIVVYSGNRYGMGWFGQCQGLEGPGVLTIIETPTDALIANDAREDQLISTSLIWQPSLGHLRYPRRVRYVFLGHGGYVAQALRFRQHAREQGYVVTLREKRDANPNVDRVIGAVNIWTWVPNRIEMARRLKGLGIDRVLWSNADSAELVETVNELGYLSSRYDIYQDLYPPEAKPHVVEANTRLAWHDGWPEDLARNADGSFVKAWVYRTLHGDYQSGARCGSAQAAQARKYIQEDLAELPYLGRFIDTVSATAWRECYDPAHPMSRADDRDWRGKLLAVSSRECGLVTGNEDCIDELVPYVHFNEGKLSVNPYRMYDVVPDLEKYRPPHPEFLKYQVGHYFRAPLWELVYHDCVVSHWYWSDYNNKVPEVWDQRDLLNILYGTPPMWVFDNTIWARYEDRFIQCYKNVVPVAAKVGYEAMTSHRFLTEGHTVQESVFADGTRVVVNFGSEAYVDADGVPVAPKGFRVQP